MLDVKSLDSKKRICNIVEFKNGIPKPFYEILSGKPVDVIGKTGEELCTSFSGTLNERIPISATRMSGFAERIEGTLRNNEFVNFQHFSKSIEKSALPWSKTVTSPCFPAEIRVYDPKTNLLNIGYSSEKTEWSTTDLRTCEDTILDIGQILDRLEIRDTASRITHYLTPENMEDGMPRICENDMLELVLDVVALNLKELPVEPLIGISLPLTVFFLVNSCNTLPSFLVPVFLTSLQTWESLKPGVSLDWVRPGIERAYLGFMKNDGRFGRFPCVAEEGFMSGGMFFPCVAEKGFVSGGMFFVFHAFISKDVAWLEYVNTRPSQGTSLPVGEILDQSTSKVRRLTRNRLRLTYHSSRDMRQIISSPLLSGGP